jgi:hypothetical protein
MYPFCFRPKPDIFRICVHVASSDLRSHCLQKPLKLNPSRSNLHSNTLNCGVRCHLLDVNIIIIGAQARSERC